MVRKFGFALLTLAIGFGLFAPNTVAEDSKKLEIATTEEIMKAVPHKKKGLVAQAVAGAKEEKWDDIKKIGETLKKYGSDLGKNKQEKGSDESWAKMCKTFEDDMNAVAKGIENKDATAVQAGAKTFSSNCKSCHDAHRN